MKIEVISIFPTLVEHWFQQGVVGRALGRVAQLRYHNPRDYSSDKFGRIDDRPFGGGSGMLMQYEPLTRIAEALRRENDPETPGPFNIYLSPQGVPLQQDLIQALAQKPHLAFWCGRYEGIDQRFLDRYIDLEVSLGDFVISGGEMAAAVMIDAILRQIDGVLGNQQSAQEDSFQQGLLDCPHYTRPEIVDRMRVPPVLLSGNHGEIQRWRLQQALGATFLRRPDIFNRLQLSDKQMALLNDFLKDLT